MNSCLYKCTVTHLRNEKLKRFFRYNYFMFYIDLDEIELISKQISIFSYNKPNIYSFRDKDYFIFDSPGIKKNIYRFLEKHNVSSKVKKIKLLTNTATFGFNFNPVSFYFCFDSNDNPICVVPEVGNTFHELKLFYLGEDTLDKNIFQKKETKYFYVSPFLEHDNVFDFNLKIPDNKLKIRIDDYKNDKKVFQASLFGNKQTLTNFNLLKLTFLFPLVTLRVFLSIHWQAFILWYKKVRFFRKADFPEKQKGMTIKWQKR